MNDRINDSIRAKQVNLILSLLPVGVIATVINSGIVTVLLWEIVPRYLLLFWVISHLVFAVIRTVMVYVFRADAKKTEHARRWEKIFTAFIMISGIIWGSSAFFGLFHNSIAYQMVVAVVLGGMCAGAAATYSALRKTYYGFTIFTLLPQIIILYFMGSSIHIAIATMLVLFTILISISAEANHGIISSNFRLLFKNEDLIKYLRDSNENAQSEIVKRKQVESELLKSRNDLEKKVKERTSALSEANLGLKTQIKRRIRVENELRVSEKYYRSIIETAQEGIWIIGENHRIYYTNQKMAQMLGYSISELRGRDICEFLDSSQKVFHGSDRRVRGIRQKNLRKRNGTIMPVIESESNLIDQSRQISVKLGMVTDITDRQNWEKQMMNLNNRLQESNRELSEFSHSVSHDLRAPLHTIQAFGALFQDEYAEMLDENGKNYLSIIRKSAERMNELIGDLLTLSRVSRAQVKREDVNLSTMVEDIVNTMRDREPLRIIDIQIKDNISANCDPGLIKIVLENLLSNSWKFTSKKDDPKITFGVDIKDGKKCFYVADNGAGFDMKYKEKLFQPFKRLHAATEFSGTGVGLATVHRIIQKHGGEIWAQSSKGMGATFYFTV